jgi:hypothetical protein
VELFQNAFALLLAQCSTLTPSKYFYKIIFNDKGILFTKPLPVNNWKLTSNLPEAEQTMVVGICICHSETPSSFNLA